MAPAKQTLIKYLSKGALLLLMSGLFASAYAESTHVSVTRLGDIVTFPITTAFASVITLNDSKLSAEVSSRIVAINAEVGQVVEKDDVLIMLDAKDYNIALQQARANLTSAQSKFDLSKIQLERANTLVSKGFISPEALNVRETDFASTKSQVALYGAKYEAAKRSVEKCSIRAPFKSVIRERVGQVGEITTPGVSLLRLSDLENIEIEAKIQPRHGKSLTASSAIQFISGERSYPVEVKRIVPVVNERERNQTVRLRFLKDKPPIGSAGTIMWRSNKPHVPVDLVVQRNGQLGVFIYSSEQATFFELPHASEGSPAFINLPLETLVIHQGQYRVQDGQAVLVSGDQ